MQTYHNVSVRLNEQEYKQLTDLHTKFNRGTIGRISLADVLREGIKELHLKQIVEMQDTVTEEETAVTEEIKEVPTPLPVRNSNKTTNKK